MLATRTLRVARTPVHSPPVSPSPSPNEVRVPHRVTVARYGGPDLARLPGRPKKTGDRPGAEPDGGVCVEYLF